MKRKKLINEHLQIKNKQTADKKNNPLRLEPMTKLMFINLYWLMHQTSSKPEKLFYLSSSCLYFIDGYFKKIQEYVL